MKHFSKITGLFLVMIPLNALLAQSTSPPATQMTHAVYKNFLELFMDYPDDALNKKQEGTVNIVFVADKNGKVSHREVKTGVSREIDSTALAIFDLLLWLPAKESGQEVESTGIYTLEFKKKKFMRLSKKRGYLHPPKNYLPYDSSGTIYPLKKTEQAPVFHLNDSTTSLSEFIYSHLTYPPNADKLGIVGDVKINFVVEINGLPSNIVAQEFVGGGCAEEAIRLVEATRWKPGMVDNRHVRTHYSLVISFQKGEHKGKHIPNQSNSGI